MPRMRAAQARRPAGGDQLPFARRPHRQAIHRRSRQGAAGQPPHAGAGGVHADPARRSAARSEPTPPRLAINPRARSAVLRVAEKHRQGRPHERCALSARRADRGQRARQRRSRWCTRARSIARRTSQLSRLESANATRSTSSSAACSWSRRPGPRPTASSRSRRQRLGHGVPGKRPTSWWCVHEP